MATFLSYISSDIRSGEKKRPEIQDFPVLLLFTDAGLKSTFWGESAPELGGRRQRKDRAISQIKLTG